ncbi:two-component regulator propeller domain-containing protein [Fibrella sp. GW2-5]
MAQDFHFNSLTSEDGLSHNSVFSIAEDYKGFMWFGTRDGISRYDGQRIKNYYFNVYSPDEEANRVGCIYAVGKQLWVGTEIGLFTYLNSTDTFRQVQLSKAPVNVYDIKRVSTGELWVGTNNGVFIVGHTGQVRHILPLKNIRSICEFRKGTFLVLHGSEPNIINAEGETILPVAIDDSGQERLASFRNYTLFKDRKGTIWLGTNGGVFQLDEKAMVFRPVDWLNQLTNPKIRVVRTMNQDDADNIWIGSESGIVIVNMRQHTVQRYDKSFATSPYSLTDRAVYSSCVSRGGTVWLGTYFGGVNYTRPVGTSFHHLFPALNGKGLAGKAISQLVEDDKQRLWIATEDAGISVLDQTTGRFTHHNRTNGLSDDNVHTVHVDKSGVAWVGTFLGGLNRIDPVTGQKRVFTHHPADSTSIANNFVCTVYRDRSNRLWVGTIDGLNIMNEKTGTFRLIRPDVLGDAFVYSVLEDVTGHIWVATRTAGVYRYNPTTGALAHYYTDNTKAFRNNQIITMYEDAKHNIWFGSINGGACYWSYEQQKIVPNPANTFLPNQTVYGILEDNAGIYWFSTNRGLLSFNPRQNTFRIFDKSNGLQATQFNFGSSLKDKRGFLYFGSVDGLCYFNPAVITSRVVDPPVYFTDLKLFNKEVKPDGSLMLSRHLDETEELVFSFSQNVITLDFVAINYFSKKTNYYTYYLEGFEKSWGPKTTKNSQTYTNLSPGQYTFHVRSYQSNGEMSPTERTIRLVIKPPFWQTTYAYLIYVLLGIGALLLYRRFITFMNHQKMAVQMERVEREKSHELNQQKLNFFTFLSHEFKTPITLIMAEIDELIHAGQLQRTSSATNYSVIKKNARRLQSLIDQITELRKTGSEQQKVTLTTLDVVGFMKETIHGFDPLLQVRHIQKRITFSHPYLLASFDANKVEMIVGNVFFFLINELAEGEEIVLNVQFEQTSGSTNAQLVLTFCLDGKAELVDTVEKSYRLSEGNEEIFRLNNATSIGILLTFSLLKLLLGKVVFSRKQSSQVISIQIPIHKSPVSRGTLGAKKQELPGTHALRFTEEMLVEDGYVEEGADEQESTDKPVILITDRNKDLAQFLKRHYQDNYRICVTYSFSETLKKAESVLPELILCDSDIHDKENRNLCKTLKMNERTQTIPIILLLDNDDDKTIIDALNSGADGYISKPFNLKELDLTISNQLKTLSLLKNKMAGSLAESLLAPLPRRNKEQEFVLRFSTLVNQQYKNKEVTADSLAQLMNCSRSQLHLKLKTLTGLSTKEYLNDYRLTLGRQLLETGLSVSEVAFEVGFSDPNYFGRAFKKKYGITPSKTV